MKLLLMLYSGADPQRVLRVLEQHDVHAFTEIDRVHGRGSTGRVEGTRAWPGENSVLFSVVPDERAGEIELALRELSRDAVPGERLHVAVLPVEHFF
ncbi:MAG TPA: hypothetical protein VFZ73_12935 [Gemmatimonadaceae bacterium]